MSMAGTENISGARASCGANKFIRRMLPCLVVKSAPSVASEEQLRKIFVEHDENKDGRLNKKELEAAFRTLGSRAPAWRADQAVYHNDLDLDGVLNEHEIDHLVAYALDHGYSTLN
ncbi:hypothetical protein Dimus_026424 [Dionaea muscipula]